MAVVLHVSVYARAKGDSLVSLVCACAPTTSQNSHIRSDIRVRVASSLTCIRRKNISPTLSLNVDNVFMELHQQDRHQYVRVHLTKGLVAVLWNDERDLTIPLLNMLFYSWSLN